MDRNSVIYLIVPRTSPGDNVLEQLVALSSIEKLSEVPMRRDELMKPDIFSEALLFLVGTLMLMLLIFTAWLAIFNQ